MPYQFSNLSFFEFNKSNSLTGSFAVVDRLKKQGDSRSLQAAEIVLSSIYHQLLSTYNLKSEGCDKEAKVHYSKCVAARLDIDLLLLDAQEKKSKAGVFDYSTLNEKFSITALYNFAARFLVSSNDSLSAVDTHNRHHRAVAIYQGLLDLFALYYQESVFDKLLNKPAAALDQKAIRIVFEYIDVSANMLSVMQLLDLNKRHKLFKRVGSMLNAIKNDPRLSSQRKTQLSTWENWREEFSNKEAEIRNKKIAAEAKRKAEKKKQQAAEKKRKRMLARISSSRTLFTDSVKRIQNFLRQEAIGKVGDQVISSEQEILDLIDKVKSHRSLAEGQQTAIFALDYLVADKLVKKCVKQCQSASAPTESTQLLKQYKARRLSAAECFKALVEVVKEPIPLPFSQLMQVHELVAKLYSSVNLELVETEKSTPAKRTNRQITNGIASNPKVPKRLRKGKGGHPGSSRQLLPAKPKNKKQRDHGATRDTSRIDKTVVIDLTGDDQGNSQQDKRRPASKRGNHEITNGRAQNSKPSKRSRSSASRTQSSGYVSRRPVNSYSPASILSRRNKFTKKTTPGSYVPPANRSNTMQQGSKAKRGGCYQQLVKLHDAKWMAIYNKRLAAEKKFAEEKALRQERIRAAELALKRAVENTAPDLPKPPPIVSFTPSADSAVQKHSTSVVPLSSSDNRSGKKTSNSKSVRFIGNSSSSDDDRAQAQINKIVEIYKNKKRGLYGLTLMISLFRAACRVQAHNASIEQKRCLVTFYYAINYCLPRDASRERVIGVKGFDNLLERYSLSLNDEKYRADLRFIGNAPGGIVKNFCKGFKARGGDMEALTLEFRRTLSTNSPGCLKKP